MSMIEAFVYMFETLSWNGRGKLLATVPYLLAIIYLFRKILFNTIYFPFLATNLKIYSNEDLYDDCTIRDCWNNGWDLSWSRPITSGTNSQHLSTVLNLLSSFTLSDAEDSWLWSLGSPSFMVKCTREHIDNNILPDGGMETRWNRYLPKKINIFIWRVLRDRLPTRWNLSRKGIDLDSLNCPICDTSVETTNHSLWFCSLATTLWHRVFVWLDIAPPNPSNIQDVFSWLDNMRLSSAQKSALEVICGVVFWSLCHKQKLL
ncbi:RNA-directed DNA polymerase, eukaryota [Tanacetum coccineum]